MSFQSLGKLEQEELSPFFESNSSAPEMYDNLHFSAITKKFSGVLQLKVKVMLICIRAKANLFYYCLLCISINCFLLSFLLVFKLGVVYYLTYW